MYFLIFFDISIIGAIIGFSVPVVMGIFAAKFAGKKEFYTEIEEAFDQNNIDAVVKKYGRKKVEDTIIKISMKRQDDQLEKIQNKVFLDNIKRDLD